MRNLLIALLASTIAPGALLLSAPAVSADSARGAQVFELQGCVQCHALNGVGPSIGPDLGRVADRGFTPASLAATMWNHAPQMWAESQLRNAARPAMSEQQAADLFAFFYSLRFFEEPGDAARGKALFDQKKCSTCHGVDNSKLAGAKPLSDWTALGDPLEMVETMWNHSATMREEMTKNHIRVPQLKGQDLADLMIYARRASGRARTKPVLSFASSDQGKALFDAKGCNKCHGTVTHFVSSNLHTETLTSIAADMWNHGLDMSLKQTTFAPGEMRQIAGYIWYARAIEGAGEAGHGAQVFNAKKCTVCHDDPKSGAPAISALASAGRFFSGATMVSALTQHGPAMLDKMREKHIAWPRLTADEMSSLIAYLNTKNPNAR